MINNGNHISIGIAGFSVMVKVAGWCNVFHQSTEYLMMGILTTPTIAKIAQALAALSRLVMACPKAIIPKYKNNRISIAVRRASHTHHAPQVGLPQTAPVSSAITVIQAPIGAACWTATSAIFIFQTKPTMPAIASEIYVDCAKKAAGTWI